MEQVDKQLLKEFQTSWAKHKYWIMSRSQQAYNDIRLLAKGNQWTQEKHTQYKNTLSELATYQPTDKTLTVAYQHIWGYFKKVVTIDEKKQYKDLIETTPLNSKELEIFLKELSQKYHQTYLLNMKWDLAPK